jgi:hypothetical protein
VSKSTIYIVIPLETTSDVIKDIVAEIIPDTPNPRLDGGVKSKRRLWLERVALAVAAFVMGAAIVLILGRPVLGNAANEMTAFIYADRPIESVLVNGQVVDGEILSPHQRRIPLPVKKKQRVSVRAFNGYEYPPQTLAITFEGQPVVFQLKEASQNE